MPGSSPQGKEWITAVIKKLINFSKIKTVLDIGVGAGTYKNYYGSLLDTAHWTGIEIWEPYITQYKLHSVYDSVVNEDVRNFDFNSREKFDLVFAGDVLEHMTKDEAQLVVNKILTHSSCVIISIPIIHWPQDQLMGNPYEQHIKDDWTNNEMIDTFKDLIIDHQGDKDIGVYLLSSDASFIESYNDSRKLKIAVYAIAKNEEHFVQQFCQSARDADLILIADTGSSDNTVATAQQQGAVVYDICVTPWRFDKARDAALALIPREYDVCISLDLDEVLEPGWREEIERVWQINTTRLRYKFDWSQGIVFYSEKIHSRHGYHWHHPCHEYIRPDARIKEVYAHTDTLLVTHHPDPSKSRGQYMDLLQLAVTEDPRCPRNAFYFARELTYNRRWSEAVTALDLYLLMPEAAWANERCYAMRLLAKSHEALGKLAEAICWYRRACAEDPNTREPWVELADACHRRGAWSECFSAAHTAVSITNKNLVYTMDPAAWGHKPHDLLALAAYNLGLYDLAVEQGQIAVDLHSTDARLHSNLEYYHEKIAQ